MAHGMIKTLDKMVSGRKRSVWHMAQTGDDTMIVDGLLTPDAARQRAFPWNPASVPIFSRIDGINFMSIPDQRAIVRNDLPTDDPRRILGVVGKRYEPIPNDVVVDLMDALTDFGARVDTAGTIHGGARVYMTALLPQTLEVEDDTIGEYLVLTTTHDGSGTFDALLTPVRIVCQNTLTLATRSAKSRVAIRHTAKYFDRLAEAQNVMKGASAYFAEHGRIMRNLAKVRIDLAKAHEYVKSLIPADSTAAKNQRNRIVELYSGAQIGADQRAMKGTAYGLINAVTQWIESDRTIRAHDGRDENEVRVDSVLFGSGAALRDKAFAGIMELAEVK